MLTKLKSRSSGLLLTLLLAAAAALLNSLVPGDVIGTSILALVLGILHPDEKAPPGCIRRALCFHNRA